MRIAPLLLLATLIVGSQLGNRPGYAPAPYQPAPVYQANCWQLQQVWDAYHGYYVTRQVWVC